MAGRSLRNLDFQLTALTFAIRDFVSPRISILREAGIRPGFRVLDYGCGPGSYVIPAAGLVGDNGVVYALDVNPLAIDRVGRLATAHHLRNIQSIVSDCSTELPDESVDVVLLYDTLHDLNRPVDVLKELHRVMKSSGTMSLSDHHLSEVEIVASVSTSRLFGLVGMGAKTYSFRKVGSKES